MWCYRFQIIIEIFIGRMNKVGQDLYEEPEIMKEEEREGQGNEEEWGEQQMETSRLVDQKNNEEFLNSCEKAGQSGEENIRWSEQEKTMLFDYHKKLGNRWSIISSLIPGTSHNIIKNHFYCVLRRGFKILNTFILQNRYKLKLKPIRMSILSKLLIVIDDKFHQKLGITEDVLERCQFIKDSLLEFSKEVQPLPSALLLKTVNQLILFNQEYRKRKKTRHITKGTMNIKKKRTKRNCNTKTQFQQQNPQLSALQRSPNPSYNPPVSPYLLSRQHQLDPQKQDSLRTRFQMLTNKTPSESHSKVEIVSLVSQQKQDASEIGNMQSLPRTKSSTISYPLQFQHPSHLPLYFEGHPLFSAFPFPTHNPVMYQPIIYPHWGQFTNQQITPNWYQM